MRKMNIILLLILSTTCKGFDCKKFADDYNHHDYAKDVSSKASHLYLYHQFGDEVTNELKTDLLNYFAVTSLSLVNYNVKVKDSTVLNFFFQNGD